ncbi:MAG: DUF4407 domain-containing protein [Bacteroidetes bacterium]|nr:DUF4407 domain-containing protein [Bacteroidota bacterium]
MKRILLFLSKTDMDVLRQCPGSAYNNQLSLGIFVLLTGVFAFLSGSYAASMLFIKTDGAGEEIPLDTIEILYSGIIGFLYACIIIAIDREIVSSTKNSATYLRIPLAISIGIILSIPIEMKLMEQKIDQQLQIMHVELYKKRVAARSEIEKNKYAASLDSLSKKVEAYSKQLNVLNERSHDEEIGKLSERSSGKAGRGPVFNKLEEQTLRIQAEYKKALLEYENVKLKEDSVINEAVNMAKADSVIKAVDFVSRYQAMKESISQDKSGNMETMNLGLKILFIFIELIPALMKLFNSTDEYQTLIETRRRLNLQMAHSITRDGMEKMDRTNGNTNLLEKYWEKILNAIEK